jgi:hypothetical protein
MMPGIQMESSMKYQANPVIVDAFKIMSFDKKEKDFAEDESGSTVTLDDGRTVILEDGMLARYTPVAGDYYVIQSDGYIYLNPKDVFERKYSPLADAEGGEAMA